MNEFVASNGIRVTLNMGYLVTYGINDSRPDRTQALREFFLAERDAELGRWRSKEHPEYVVYPQDDENYGVLVVTETSGSGGEYVSVNMAAGFGPTRRAVEVAREFFATHPEPKPWHEAQHGEVWALTTTDAGEQPYQVVRTEESGFRFFLIADQEGFRPGLFPNEEQIIAGRRIWPEA